MASVFLSYDRDDTDAARPIASALEKAGHSVWWDLHVRGGAQFSKVIEEALKAADAVVVLWSRNSIESAWVRDEAAAGRDSGRLVPATIDGTEPPLGFRQFQTIDLTDRKRGARARGYSELEQAIAAVANEAFDPASASPSSPVISRKGIRIGWLPVGGVAVTLLVAGLGAWRFSGGSSAVPVVAVAPAGRSANAEVLSRDLLFKLGSLRAAKTDAVRLTAANGEAVHADFIFETGGSNVALLAGKDRSVLWSKDFDGPATSQSTLEQSMAYTAGQVLDCALQANAASPRLDEQTLKLFLNGCALYADRYFSNSVSVVPIFERVVASAPKFQPAWAKLLLAEGEDTRGEMVFYDRLVAGRLPEHIEAVSRLNPHLPELYVAKTALLPLSAREERFRLLNEAIRLAPDNPSPYLARTYEEDEIGRTGDSVDDARRAAELDPLSPGMESNLIQGLAYGGQITAAEQELRHAEQLWPDSHTIADARFRIVSRFGDAREALEILHSAGFRQDYPTSEMEAYLLARIDPSETNIRRALAAAQNPQLPQSRRTVQTVQLLGDFGRDNELYDVLRGLSPAQLTVATSVMFRPSLHKFRQDPRFMQIVARAGLVDFWRKSGKWPDFCFEPDLPYDCKKEAAKLH